MNKDDQQYDAWLTGYLERGKQLESELSKTIMDVINRSSTPLALPELRVARSSFPHPFCLFLYSSKYDYTLALDLFRQTGIEVSEEARAQIPEMVSTNVIQALTVLMLTLDAIGIHLLLLERKNDRAPDGPVRLQVPDEMWFPTFAQLSELAHFIALPGSVGRNMMQEILYLRDAGLRNRIVIYLNGKLFYVGDAENFEYYQIDKLPDVVKRASAQPPSASSGSFIKNPLLPEWVVKDLERKGETADE